MSHGMLHHIEPKYSLNCYTYLIWFEFELKTLEKTIRKAIRNSRKKEKTNSAQISPLSTAPARAPARARCLTSGPRLSAPTRVRSLPLSALWGRAVGVVLSPRALSISLSLSVCLSRRPHLSAVPNSRPCPTISPSWTCPRPRVLRPCPRARAPFEPRALLAHLPSLFCALSQTPSPSLSLSLSLSRARALHA
jgi:hypothetical protein